MTIKVKNNDAPGRVTDSVIMRKWIWLFVSGCNVKT
jgi:hypothetical protein